MTPPIVILGAGLSGIACARALINAMQALAGQVDEIPVVVLEKSRSFGGRCATRLWEGDVVDHGVLFFEESQVRFTAAAREVAAEDLIPLTAPVFDGKGQIIVSGRGRYTHRAGANRLARALAEGLDVRREHLVTGFQRTAAGHWEVLIAERESLLASAIVLTAPGPQTAALLSASGMQAGDPATTYAPCLTGLFAYAGEGRGLADQALARQGDAASVVAWSVCENHKPGRIQPGHIVLVAHGSPAFSKAHLESSPGEWLSQLREAVEALWEVPAGTFLREFGHRWRYAQQQDEPHGGADASMEFPGGLWVCGDSLSASTVEAVWCSGEATAHRMLPFLKTI